MEKVIVTAPYVMLKVKDATGGVTVRDFYKDAVLPDGADSADVERLLGKGMLGKEPAEQPEPVAPAPEQESQPEDKPEPAKKAAPAAKKTGNG